VIADARLPLRFDWDGDVAVRMAELLDSRPYRTTTRYDALDRPTSVLYPEAADGRRRELRARYHPSGALRRVEVDGTTFLEHAAHDARGRPVLAAYGNGVMTRSAYDPLTSRLARMRTERFTRPAPLTFAPVGAPLQDCAYRYDLAGNLLALRERTPGCGVAPTPDRLDRNFAYDALYRLVTATGRECDAPPTQPFDPAPRPADPTRTRAYSESYSYDRDGNLLALAHQSTPAGSARAFTHAPGGNRLATMTTGGATFDYAYDAAGNLVRETTSRHFEWDARDRLRAFRTQAPGSAEPSLTAHYLYDGAGRRVKKVVRKSGRTETTVYVDGLFEHRTVTQAAGAVASTTLHVMAGASRVAEVRVGPAPSGDATPPVKYHLADHLGSSTVVLDDAGALVNREEYTPYGETSFGSYGAKRYRFTGAERDEESGLGYHAARYYAPWLARWMSCDPAGAVDGLNLYRYVGDNPLRAVDPSGTQSEDADDCRCSRVPVKPRTSTQKKEARPGPKVPARRSGFDHLVPKSGFEGLLTKPSPPSTPPPKAPPRPATAPPSTAPVAMFGSIVTVLGAPSTPKGIDWLARAAAAKVAAAGGAVDVAEMTTGLTKAFKGLNAWSAGATGITSIASSPASTWWGKGIDGILATAGSYYLGDKQPVIMALDVGLTWASGGELSISNTVAGAAHGAATAIESLFLLDPSSFKEFQRLSRDGKYGWGTSRLSDVSDFFLPQSVTGSTEGNFYERYFDE
jgi:RHS repeat-associated protein